MSKTGQFVSMKKVVIFFCVIGAFACTREPEPADLVKHMVVQTIYNVEEVNDAENVFTTYSKFLLRKDTIGYVFPQGDPADTILVDGVNMSDYVTPVVNEVESKITAAGFERTTSIDDADFVVNIVVLQNFSFFQSVSYPNYYSGYYNYYGYYYPIVTNYYANYATMVIEVVDVKNFIENGSKYKVIWKANIGDLLTTVDLRAKTLEAVDQAFAQSPYFSKD